jgi:transposase InsO family protein
MFAILHALGMFAADLFKPRWRLEAEKIFLHHQLNIALMHPSWPDCIINTSRYDFRKGQSMKRSSRHAQRSAAILDSYNSRRPHSGLDRLTPDQAYFPSPQLVAA